MNSISFILLLVFLAVFTTCSPSNVRKNSNDRLLSREADFIAQPESPITDAIDGDGSAAVSNGGTNGDGLYGAAESGGSGGDLEVEFVEGALTPITREEFDGTDWRENDGQVYNTDSGGVEHVDKVDSETLSQAIEVHQTQLAQPVFKINAPTLNNIYHFESNLTKQNVLYYIDYGRDFAKYNAFSNSSEWFFNNYKTSNPADHALYVFPGQSSYGDGFSGGANDSSVVLGQNNGVVLTTKPFTSYVRNNDSMASTSYYEAFELKKQLINISANDSGRYLFRTKCRCKLINMERHPFPRKLVNKTNDDPRLGNCAFGFFDANNLIIAYFQVTNQGVWAVYESQANLHFFSRRRVANRASYNDLVDGAVEYDGLLNAINWYINGQKVWTVYALGSPPPQDSLTSIDIGQGTMKLVRLSSIGPGFGFLKFLDQKDPNNLQSNIRLVKVQTDSSMTYGRNDRFYDSAGLRRNVLWGQGGAFPLYKLLIIRANATSVYGQAIRRPSR